MADLALALLRSPPKAHRVGRVLVLQTARASPGVKSKRPGATGLRREPRPRVSFRGKPRCFPRMESRPAQGLSFGSRYRPWRKEMKGDPTFAPRSQRTLLPPMGGTNPPPHLAKEQIGWGRSVRLQGLSGGANSRPKPRLSSNSQRWGPEGEVGCRGVLGEGKVGRAR